MLQGIGTRHGKGRRMFMKSESSRQSDLFSGFEAHLKVSRQKQLNDPKAWHNLFFGHITAQIDETPYGVFFDEHTGRPNAPVRQLVAMMILKEGHGWSDAGLFEHGRFNLLVMRALGMTSLSDEVPALSTYYLFKQSLYAHEKETGQDLIGETFAQLTRTQAKAFGVLGQQIRMDSKLIGSNIATCCRLQLVLGCLQSFWASLDEADRSRMSTADREVLDGLLKKKPHQTVYRLSRKEKETMLCDAGRLLRRLVRTYSGQDSDRHGLIERALSDQYATGTSPDDLCPRPAKEVKASSLQSVSDLDAAYRKKGAQKVKGYSVNLTETCNDQGPNLITDLDVEAATTPDNTFVQPAVERTQEVVGPVEEVSMDGAYQDGDNADYAQATGKTFHYSGIRGSKGRLAYEQTGEGVMVTDTRTGQTQRAAAYKPGRYRIFVDGKPRYFTDQTIEAFERRRQIEALPEAIRRRRNNVEASIFQLSCYTRNGKTRYRGQVAHQRWAWCRGLWINLVRIRNHLVQSELVPA